MARASPFESFQVDETTLRGKTRGRRCSHLGAENVRSEPTVESSGALEMWPDVNVGVYGPDPNSAGKITSDPRPGHGAHFEHYHWSVSAILAAVLASVVLDTDTVESTVKTLLSQFSLQFFTDTVESTVKTLGLFSLQFFTDTVESTVKTLLSQVSL